jgi:hypothetical protein
LFLLLHQGKRRKKKKNVWKRILERKVFERKILQPSLQNGSYAKLKLNMYFFYPRDERGWGLANIFEIAYPRASRSIPFIAVTNST